MKKADKILTEQILKIKPNEQELEKIKLETSEIVKGLEESLKRKKIKSSVFIGGSLAKGTLIKKKNYDIDIFVRFEYDKDIIKLGKLIKAIRIHGSRDYFQIKKKNMIFEIIPVLKISRPEQAKNITDLSYFHVNYVLNKIKKNKKLAEEIMLAKAFCFSQRCYGAESYIRGFSGYALELLVIYYGSFLKFIKQISKAREKIIIDPEKFFKNKQVMLELNESKLQSPIVFIDPTFKERNALAALSSETFSNFKESCKRFLKNPSKSFFSEKIINSKKFTSIIEIETSKQEGDIAGSKLAKFSRFIASKIERYFEIKNKEFEYTGEKKGRLYLKLMKRKEIIYPGPPINNLGRLLSFKQAHKKVFLNNGKAFAREKSLNFQEFWRKFLADNKKVMEDMGISGLKIVKK